ncbi:hypothetical protein MP228_011021 [Amoeboaphelidium protococcarum]|nr:hypothetical protein MP228_011021 [Amoeboaphelidium protococcarum]
MKFTILLLISASVVLSVPLHDPYGHQQSLFKRQSSGDGPPDLSALEGFQMQPNYYDSDGLIKTEEDLVNEGVSPQNAKLLQEYNKQNLRSTMQSRFLTDDGQVMSEAGRKRVAEALNMSPQEVAEQETYARGRAPSPDFPPNSVTNNIRASIYHGGRMLNAFEVDDQGNPIRLRDDSALQQQGWTDEEIQDLKQTGQYLDQELQERANSPSAPQSGQSEGAAAAGAPPKEELPAPAAGDGAPTPSDQVGAGNPQDGVTPSGVDSDNAEGNKVQAGDSSQRKPTTSDHIKDASLHGKPLIDAFEVDAQGNPTGLKDTAALEADGWTSDEIEQWIQPRAEQLNQELNQRTSPQTNQQPGAPVASESTSTPEPSSGQEAQAKNSNAEDTLPPNLQQQAVPSAPSPDANGAKVKSDLPGTAPAPVPVVAPNASPPAETAAVAPKVNSQQDTAGDQKPETGPSAGAQQENVGNNVIKKPTNFQQPGQKAEVKAPVQAPIKTPTPAPIKAPTPAPIKAPAPAKVPVKAPTPVKASAPAKAPAVPQKPAKAAPAASKAKTGNK